ncbi:hypothetical protein F4859DRAFT_508286 [Xylaria cf. heliscus]|nr:hypothetical protein F4859DRAFT_508286 [Xylaria cf. heliscus]
MASALSLDLVDEIMNSPAAQPPPGVIPDFANPPNQTRLALGVIKASAAVAVLAGLLRFYSKVFCTDKLKLKLEDYLGFASFPFFLAAAWALCQIPNEAGFFIHQWDLQIKGLEAFLYVRIH